MEFSITDKDRTNEKSRSFMNTLKIDSTHPGEIIVPATEEYILTSLMVSPTGHAYTLSYEISTDGTNFYKLFPDIAYAGTETEILFEEFSKLLISRFLTKIKIATTSLTEETYKVNLSILLPGSNFVNG